MSGEKDKEIIRRIAFRIYKQRKLLELPGDPHSDWIEAEKEYKRWKLMEESENLR